MTAYILRRIASTIPVMLIVAFILFGMLNVVGGDPALVLAGDNATTDAVARIRTTMGLDQPFLVRFANWLLAIARGDLGQSLFSGHAVLELIQQRLEPTLALAICTLVLSVLIAVPLGIVAAWRVGGVIDNFVMSLAVIGFSVPVFALSYLGIYIFSLQLRWLPVQGYVSYSVDFGRFLAHIVLPSFALSISYVGLIARVTRACVLEVIGQDFIRTAKAKGATPFRVLGKHVLKNAAPPIVTVVGMGFAMLIGGVVVTETVFGISGLGRLAVDAVFRRDYPVVQGVVLLLSLTYVLVNLLVDLSYVLFDPRIKY